MARFEWPGRALARLGRRPFGRLNTSFYEWEAATAVAEIAGPVIAERIRSHLEAGGDRLASMPVVDVGAGGGQIAARVAAATGRTVFAVEPSASQARNLARRASELVRPMQAPAEDLPADDGSVATVYSSCTIKHWRDVDAGLREAVRVVAPGGLLLTIEIDGGRPGELRAFARRAKVPRALEGLYVRVVGGFFDSLGPTADDVADRLAALGATEVTAGRVPGFPLWIAAATAPA